MKKAITLLMATLPFASLADIEYHGEAGLEQRYFFEDAAYSEQERGNLSGYFSPELYTSFNDGDDSIVFKGFLRVDQQDSERTHADIREFKWTHSGAEWEFQAGIGKVFWGQTESLHLVDIINQTDAVEAIDGEDKLGQPMVTFSLFKDWGNTTVYILPYFRERTFSGVEGRFRAPFPVDSDNTFYESEDGQEHLDWAARWQHSIGSWDIGLSYFDGTSREPNFTLETDEFSEVSLRPYYPLLQQVGIDALGLLGDWTIKFEGVQRRILDQESNAFVGGFEYSFTRVFDSSFDINWLMEYQYDERELVTQAQNDFMLGSRVVFNDIDGTEVLFGVVQDLDYSSVRSGFIEASSRINDNWKWRVDAWMFSSDEMVEPTYLIRRDDYLQFSLEYYF